MADRYTTLYVVLGQHDRPRLDGVLSSAGRADWLVRSDMYEELDYSGPAKSARKWTERKLEQKHERRDRVAKADVVVVAAYQDEPRIWRYWAEFVIREAKKQAKPIIGVRQRGSRVVPGVLEGASTVVVDRELDQIADAVRSLAPE